MKKNNKSVFAFSTFCKQRPKCVTLQQQILMNQCGCDHCINFKLACTSLTANGVKSLPSRVTENILNSMCQVNGNSPDILQYNHDCLFQLCKSCCYEKIIFEDILRMLTTKNLKKKCCYKCWKNRTKTIDGKEYSAFERPTITCTFEELIEQYVCDVLAMRQHNFHLEWQ